MNRLDHNRTAGHQPGLVLGFGIAFEDLYRRDGLVRLDSAFLTWLRDRDPAACDALASARANGITGKAQSELMIALAPHLEDFLGELFGITPALRELRERHSALAPVMFVKRKFVLTRANRVGAERAQALDGPALRAELEIALGAPFTESLYAREVSKWMESTDEKLLDLAGRYAAWAVHTPAGRHLHARDVIFNLPKKLDMLNLVPAESITINGLSQFAFPHDHWRRRDGFELTDPGTDLRGALDQAAYCIKCHKQDKDSCNKGLRNKAGEVQSTVFGVPLIGCPLEERISEMHELKGQGSPIGALAVVTVDNPLCAATGHRICNDCMKSCIYQKSDPVNIPEAESRVLKDVLDLPWGFEVYSLLTRWNPLHFTRFLPAPSSTHAVLVVGLGPAGFSVAHHLMNDGHTVVAVDGLKIEPLPADLSGVDAHGKRHPFRPVRDVNELYERLDERAMAGFGGVAEYGITVRWNKNFLKIIRLLLERRAEFAMFGGVRFGGTLSIDSAFDMGFDHIALCAGAGKPTVIPMKNGLARGVRQASDFLMGLQLTGAAKKESITNLQLRMPVVVIGGGLTAIDTATESLAYYIVQVEKFLHRYETLAAELGEAAVEKLWLGDEAAIAREFIAHGRQARAERERAAAESRPPRFTEFLNAWGGVTVAYRRRMIDSPSYTLNHEEIIKAMEEGIRFAEELTPESVEVDEFAAAKALVVKTKSGQTISLPARTILVAAGTQPNTVLAREDTDNVVLDGKYFRALDEDGNPVKPERTSKPSAARVLMSLRPDGRAVSFFGDLHPSYAGNVVKAMAGAKQGYPVVSRALARTPKKDEAAAGRLVAKVNDELRAVVHAVHRLTHNIVEVIIHAPAAARAFRPGQFFRLQNYEQNALRVGDTTLAMEGIALTGAKVDVDRGLLTVIVLEMGGSSDLCALLKPGEPVVLMGPTGAPTETPEGETVALVGGGLGNAVLFSIGQQLRALGSKVIYFAGYKKAVDRYKVDEIERAADVITWCCDEAPGFTPSRPQDKAFVGNIVAAMEAYGAGKLGPVPIPLNQAERMIVIGSDGMMRGVQQARHAVLKPHLKPGHCAIGSINSPMQCMMKEICAQCLQTHVDPATGEESVVFSCFNQDQHLDHVKFETLRARLSQNGVQEKVTKLWIDRSLRKAGLRTPATSAEKRVEVTVKAMG